MSTQWRVYILKCSDGTYYTGYTSNLDFRLEKHNSGHGAKYTRGRRPVTIAYSESFPSRSEAAQREIQIKRWPRSKKQALINGD